MWLFNSSIGKKVLMSLTGFFLIVFLLLHATINVVAIFSESGYNAACDFMGTNPVVQLMVPILALGFILHIAYAFVLTIQNRRARGTDRYASSSKTGIDWSSKNMLVLGVVVLGVLGWHLTHFWAKMQLLEWTGKAPEQGFALVVQTFSNPIVVVCYLIWLLAIWFHLSHGAWSAFQTLGWNNKIWFKRLRVIGIIYATIVCLMFAVVAVAFYLHSIGLCDNIGHIWTLGSHAAEHTMVPAL
ncbi:MAG: succinate dehydrogenase [Porphyromonas sp.]|nr:succinate dehydrogenase [Porphyromonas sp.]